MSPVSFPTVTSDEWPPVDVFVLSALFVGAAGLAVLLAGLSLLTGPALDRGPSPQLVSGMLYFSVGIVALAVGIGLYNQRPYGWYGGVVGTVLTATAYVWTGEHALPLVLLYVVLPTVVLAALFVRRDLFLG